MWEIVILNGFRSQFYYMDRKELFRKWFLLKATYLCLQRCFIFLMAQLKTLRSSSRISYDLTVIACHSQGKRSDNPL